MKRRWLTSLSVLLALAVAALVFIRYQNQEPEYRSKTIGYWFRQACQQNGNDLSDRMALAEAVKAIGEPAVPFLLRQTQYRQGFIKTKWLQLEPHLPEFVQRFSPHPPSEDLVRGAAYLALIDMGPLAKSAVPELTNVLRFPRNDPTTLEHIQLSISVLGSIGSEAKDAVPCLVEFVSGQLKSNKNDFLLEEAIQALEGIGPDAKAAVPRLHSYLENANHRLRVAAALALWKIDGQTNLAMRVVESALDDKTNYTVVVAIRALRKMSAPNELVVPRMITLLNHPARQVRCEAVVTLGERRTAAVAAVPHLVELIRDEDCRSVTLSALAQIRPAPEATIRAFAEFLLDSDQDNSRRAEVARYLGEFGTEAIAAVPSLIRALTDKDEMVPANAAFALWQIDHLYLNRSLPVLLAQLKSTDEVRVYQAAICLGEMKRAATEAIPALEQALDRRYKWDSVKDRLEAGLERIKGDQNTRP